MKWLFFGFLLIFLDFNLTLNGHMLNLLPDFAGYYLILRGLQELTPYSGAFAKACPAAKVMLVYGVIYWTAQLIALPLWGAAFLSLLFALVELYGFYWIINGILDLERQHAADLCGHRLWRLWCVLAVVNILLAVLNCVLPASHQLIAWIGDYSMVMASVAVILGAAGIFAFVVAVLILVRLYHAWRAWEALEV